MAPHGFAKEIKKQNKTKPQEWRLEYLSGKRHFQRGNCSSFLKPKIQRNLSTKATLSLENRDGHDPLKISNNFRLSEDQHRPRTIYVDTRTESSLVFKQMAATAQEREGCSLCCCCHSISPHALSCLLIHPKDGKRLASRYSFLYDATNKKTTMLLQNELKKDWLSGWITNRRHSEPIHMAESSGCCCSCTGFEV